MEPKKKPFSNILEYAKRNLNTFEQDPLNEVDCLIFSWLVYMNIHEDVDIAFLKEGIAFRDLLQAEYFEEMFDKTWSPDETLQTLFYCASSPRFRDVRLRYYRNEIMNDINLQFAALVFSISPEEHVLAYRGTDWTITGWKEDALLALENPIPAQRMSVSYFNEVAGVLPGGFTVVGHSKGGSIAVYAAGHCDPDVQERIRTVYSFDGPGMLKSAMDDPGFLVIRSRIRKFVPQSSYFGMLFENETEQKIVHSNETAVMQHNPVSWEVSGNRLYCEQDRDPISSFLNERINSWLNSLDEHERKILIQAIFDVIYDLNINSIDEFMNSVPAYIPDILKSISKMDPERRKYVLRILRLILIGDRDKKKEKESMKEIPTESFETPEEFEGNFQLFIKK